MRAIPANAAGKRSRGKVHLRGTELYYECTGSGPAVIFIPTMVSDRRIWANQIATIAQTYQAVRYDLRGFGRSGPPNGTHRHAEDLHDLLDYLGIDRAVLVGFGYGSTIALEFTLDHPERVAGLVLTFPQLRGFWPRAFMPSDRPPLEIETGLDRLLEALSESSTARRVVKLGGVLMTKGPVPADTINESQIRANSRKLYRRILMITMLNAFRVIRHMIVSDILRTRLGRLIHHPPGTYNLRWLDPPAIDRLTEILAPTLVVIPARPGTPTTELSAKMLTDMKHAELLAVPHAEVYLHVECSQLFNAELLSFVNRCFEGQAGVLEE